jgi:3'(2'), 5'-bisphosphate nucleotidase
LPQLPLIYQRAVEAAIEASIAIDQIYNQDFHQVIKLDGSPVTDADIAASECIEKILQPLGIPITSEESDKAPFEQRQYWQQCWCIDPLDGTKEFIKRNGEFAVNIALIKNGEPIFGLIASPVQEQVLLGSKETGVFIFRFQDWQAQEKWIKITPPLKTNYPLVMACSRSHHSGPVLQIIHQLQNEGQSMEFIKKGSALKFFDLAKGSADIYPRFAPTMEWDIAAGQAILEALGGEVIHAETGEPLRYNKANLVNPYFIARTKAMKESKR